MWNEKKFLCIIPARGGSQGIKDKNIKIFNQRPLIHWALDAAVDSGCFDKIAVSTDSKKIEWSVKQHGSDTTLFKRPRRLATARSHVMDTMAYHCREMEERGEKYDFIMLHQAVSPLVTKYDIQGALKYLLSKEADFVVSVCPSTSPLGVAKPIPKDNLLKDWFPHELRNLNRQEIKEPYQLDNNIYVGKWDIFKYNVDYWETDIYAYRMPLSKKADIDTDEDFLWAEALHRRQTNGKN